MFYYIHTTENLNGLAFTTSPVPIEIKNFKKGFELSKEDLAKYNLYIKYIDCCTLEENNTLRYDCIKILSKKLNQLSSNITRTTKELRKLLVEASALNKPTIVDEIAQTIKTLNEFQNSDFSNITDITQIENITCPELHVDYNKHYVSRIYEI